MVRKDGSVIRGPDASGGDEGSEVNGGGGANEVGGEASEGNQATKGVPRSGRRTGRPRSLSL